MEQGNKIVVLGAGVAGIAAAYHLQELGESAVVYEKESTYGGLCNSFKVGEFTFDTFGHISFDKATELWLEKTTPYYVHTPEALNYDRKQWLRHPVQNNLYKLSIEEKIMIIMDFIGRDRDISADNYAQWLKSTYGNTFAIKYPFRYTRKYWTVDPELLGTNWIKNRMYVPTLEEILRGAMTTDVPSVHYSGEAHYPKRGGFKAFLSAMVKKCNIIYNKEVIEIDADNKRLYFQDGKKEEYDYLISTIPLTELCNIVKSAPYDIIEEAKKLNYTSAYLVSLGIKGERISPSLWFYIYDEDILPARVNAPDWQSPYNVPKGYSALQAEVYFSRFKTIALSEEEVQKAVILQLADMGIVKEKDIVIRDIRKVKYANIMFTKDICKVRNLIHDYLREIQIDWAGRFGEWDYLWVGQSLMSGRKAAERIKAIC